MALPGPIDDAVLQAHLLAHAESLRHYVAAKIPAQLANVLSPDDVLQEAWVAAFRHISGFVPSGPDALDRWLITIVNRKIIDALKTAQRVKRSGHRHALQADTNVSSSLVGLLAQIAAPERTPSREVSIREASTALHVALSGLGDERRRVITMRFVEGLSPKQIAEKMGKSYAAVNSLLFHSLRELRMRLGQATKFFSDARSMDRPANSEADAPGSS